MTPTHTNQVAHQTVFFDVLFSTFRGCLTMLPTKFSKMLTYGCFEDVTYLDTTVAASVKQRQTIQTSVLNGYKNASNFGTSVAFSHMKVTIFE
ncbi:hypothetical protein JTE90_024931 [Oedothorax gibbosus]|uniref:Uncharacterized protein n=1 Tax=Oedothorax gibbosus TaxID=931172 RepID=A0AAV6TJX0_9ARAC|nr:hypothetical protein JTE90_024931 [Oedothorax gibbosus]